MQQSQLKSSSTNVAAGSPGAAAAPGKRDTNKLKGMTFAEGEAALAPPQGVGPGSGGAGKGAPLGLGAQGPEVLALQQFLKRASKEAEVCTEWKVDLDPGPLDGRFGKSLDRALRTFQSWKLIPLTGTLDAATAAEIKDEIAFLDMIESAASPAATKSEETPKGGKGGKSATATKPAGGGAAKPASAGATSGKSTYTSARALITELRLHDEDVCEMFGKVVLTRGSEQSTVDFFIDSAWGADFDDSGALAKHAANIQAKELEGYPLDAKAKAELAESFAREVSTKGNSVDWNHKKFEDTEYAWYTFSS